MSVKNTLLPKLPTNIWVIVPGYNEQRYISTVLQKVLRLTPNVIMVDDGSSDATFKLAGEYTPYVLRHAINLGKGAAMRTGADYAFSKRQAEAVVFLDADDQHDPAELPLFIQKLEKGSQVVLGVRTQPANMPKYKIIISQFASYLIQFLFGTYIPDIPSGYKLISKVAYPSVRWQSNGYEVEMEIATRVAKKHLPFESVEIKTIYHDMNKGLTPLDLLHMLHLVLSWKFFL
jgi:glycosyltransferase involved in cell wall biosynthesis